jgi:hypothetical protein
VALQAEPIGTSTSTIDSSGDAPVARRLQDAGDTAPSDVIAGGLRELSQVIRLGDALAKERHQSPHLIEHFWIAHRDSRLIRTGALFGYRRSLFSASIGCLP